MVYIMIFLFVLCVAISLVNTDVILSLGCEQHGRMCSRD